MLLAHCGSVAGIFLLIATIILVKCDDNLNKKLNLLSFQEFQKLFPTNDGRGVTNSIKENVEVVTPPQRGSRQEMEITLISFLQQAVKKYGEKKVALSVYELAQRSLYDLVWLLAGDLEPWLIYDMYKLYNAASADPNVLSVYDRFQKGQVNRAIVPEVFALDRKYNEYPWYKRVRTRLLENTDKYMAGNLVVSNSPPKIEFGEDGKPIIEGKPETDVAQMVGTTNSTSNNKGRYTTTTEPDDPDLDLEDLLEGLID